MQRTLVLSVVLVLLIAGCGADDRPESPLGDARTYYESLDLSTPSAAADTFATAFARDDFMTVWLILDPQAQFHFTQVSNLLEYDHLVNVDAVAGFDSELQQAFSFERMESSGPWYFFDQLMLIADRHDAFLIDLSGEVVLGESRTTGDSADVPAEVEGLEGEITFRLTRSPSGRWRVHQVVVPGGNEDNLPWAVPETSS